MSFILWLLGAVMAFAFVDRFNEKKDTTDWLMIAFWPVTVAVAIVQEIAD